jgi:hypothetical protein
MTESFPKFRITNKLTSFIPQTHKWLDRLPEPWRSKAIIFGYKLGIIPSFGYLKIVGYTDDTFTERNGQESVTCNIITDQGATALRAIIAASLNGAGINKQAYMDFGIGTSDPVVGDTGLQTQPGGIDHPRLICTITSPGLYEIRCESFISSGWGDTRPIAITEMALFTALTGIDNIAHALVVPTHDLTGANTAIATYGILVR